MAVCWVWDVKGRLDHPLNYATNPKKTEKLQMSEDEFQGLRDVMNYAANSKKTSASDVERFVDGVNCDAATARREMIITKKQFTDDSDIIAFHAFQSFAPSEVDEKTAHEIGIKLAQKMWGDRFQVVVATHLNTKCLHNHFIINATSFVDGKRYYDNKENLRKVRALSDELCKEYELSVIDNADPYKTHTYLYRADKAGMPTRYNRAREVIDEAIAHSYKREDFFKQLSEMGYSYDFRDSRKYATIKPKEYEKSIRIHQLGVEYTKERIFERIKENTLTSTSAQTVYYDGTAKSFAVTWGTPAPSSSTVKYYTSVDKWGNKNYVTPINIGTYNVEIKATGNSNISDFSNDISNGLQIVDKLSYALSAASVQTVDYNSGSAQAYSASNLTWASTTIPSSITISYRLSGTSGAFTSTAPTNAGTYDIKVTVAASADHKAYDSGVLSGKLVINKVNPPYTVPPLAPVTYSPTQKLSNITLPSGWTWVDATIVPTVGNSGYSATFNSGNPNYNTVTATVPLTVNKATPAYAVPVPAAFTYDPDKTLNTVTLPSDWAWVNDSTQNPAAIVPTVDNKGYKAVFTPSETDNYNTVTVTVSLTVTKANPTIPVLDAITYNPKKTLSKIDLPTDWMWINDKDQNPTKTVPTVGNSGYRAIYIPSDPINYNSVTATISLTVKKAEPAYTIPTLDAITYNPSTKLSDITLPDGWTWVKNASQKPGKIVPPAGTNSYKVKFTPKDTTNYKTVTKTITLTVNKATPDYEVPTLDAVTYDSAQTLDDITLPAGWAWDDATIVPTVGNSGYSATFTPADTANYNTVTETIALTVNQATPTVTPPTFDAITFDENIKLSDITFPTSYSAITGKGGSSSVSGTWAWADPTAALKIGTFGYSAIFTPSNPNYKPVTMLIYLTVNAVATITDPSVPQASTPVATTSSTTITNGNVAKAGAVKTNDSNSGLLMLYTAIFGVSAAGVTGLAYRNKKKEM